MKNLLLSSIVKRLHDELLFNFGSLQWKTV